MSYCVDTSGWLDGWQRNYPPDVFPTLWRRVEVVIGAGDIFSSEEVYIELQKKDDEIHDWMKARKEMLVPLTEEIQTIASDLLSEFPRLVDTLRNRSKADPFVIATAIDRKATVVTGEPITGNMTKPRIPDVCNVRGVRCINFLQMIRELKLTF
jgi:uncharacterized protein DUF4411